MSLINSYFSLIKKLTKIEKKNELDLFLYISTSRVDLFLLHFTPMHFEILANLQ